MQKNVKKSDCDKTSHTHEDNKIIAASDGHEHRADVEERYEEIVGSLGEVNDEGCLDLNGVRLISKDISYESETEQRDYAEIARAIVLGEIINNPRFKNPYKK